MQYIYLLSNENLSLAREELLAAASTRSYKQLCNAMILYKRVNIRRLAYTRAEYKLLFLTTRKGLERSINEFSWKSAYSRSFCVRISKIKGGKGQNKALPSEKELASMIWHKLDKPNVDLEKPGSHFEFFFTGEKVLCGRLLRIAGNDFQQRKPHLRPGFLPTSLSPRLARAMVNLIGIRRGTITDPFCGSGGILIEAGLLGFKVIGYDIDNKAILECRKNMRHFGIKKSRIMQKDACSIRKAAYVVSDLPYGRSSRLSSNINELYSSFFSALGRAGAKRAVIGLPSNVSHRKILAQAGLKATHEFSYYLHKSLTKKIIVIEPIHKTTNAA